MPQRHIFHGLLAVILFFLAVPEPAFSQNKTRPPKLDLPIKCTLGQDCFIQHYMDTDPSEGAADYMCGSLTREKHQGTDIRIQTIADMIRGVPVIAAAEGRVVNLRDGINDQYFEDYAPEKMQAIINTGLGNAVIINHGGGWETYYGHLKKNSLTVRKGQRVRRGDILGYVGMSGLTDFPHIHFELRYRNKRIDPFTGDEPGKGCGETRKNYWTDLARQELAYQPTGFMATGFSETKPMGRRDLESGKRSKEVLDPTAPALFFWSYYIGSRKGDQVTLLLKDPDGKILASHKAKPRPKHQITHTPFIGKKKPRSGWKRGLYRGEITIDRDGTLIKDSAIITVN